MKYTEVLTELLRMHEFQAKHPDIWHDTTWKETYFTLLNKVNDALERLDIEELAK